MSALLLASGGWVAPIPIKNPALSLMSDGWIYEYVQPYVPPDVPPDIPPDAPTTSPLPPHRIGGPGPGMGGGVIPIWVLPQSYPTAPAPSQEDVDARAQTLAAALGVAVGGGDEADRIAATLALLLSRRRS